MSYESVWETTGQDWANHLSHELSGSAAVCFAVMLSQEPDAALLCKAAEDVIALQPILGCRFDDTQEPPVWVPAENNDWFSQAEADNVSEGLDAFLQSGMAQGRQMQIQMLSCKGQSVLCVLFDHAATDGGGAKACLALLSECYNRRLTGEKAPESPLPDRSDAQVFVRCGIGDFRMALKREAPAAGPITTIPYASMDGRKLRHCWVSLPLSNVRHPGFTVNDRLLAAYARALHDEGQKEESPVAIHMTVDLRRYLDHAAAPAACNLSGMEAVTIRLSANEPFATTLAAIKEQTERIKTGQPGIGSAALMACLRIMPYGKARAVLMDAAEKIRRLGVAAPILSNLGLFSQESMHFGDAAVTDIVPLLPVMHAPAFMLGASSCGDTLTLSAGFYEEEREVEKIMRLLKRMRDWLLD